MEISSRIVATDGSVPLPVVMITSGDKTIGAAVIVGESLDGPSCETGQACVDLLARAGAEAGLAGDFLKVEVALHTTAAARVEMVIACARNGDVIVFVCRDVAAFDVVWRALRVKA